MPDWAPWAVVAALSAAAFGTFAGVLVTKGKLTEELKNAQAQIKRLKKTQKSTNKPLPTKRRAVRKLMDDS